VFDELRVCSSRYEVRKGGDGTQGRDFDLSRGIGAVVEIGLTVHSALPELRAGIILACGIEVVVETGYSRL